MHAIVGGMSGVDKDVIPYGSVIGNRAKLGGLNIVGLKRRGFERETIHALRGAYRMIFHGEGQDHDMLAGRAAAAATAYTGVEPVQQIAAFIHADTSRNLCTPRAG